MSNVWSPAFVLLKQVNSVKDKLRTRAVFFAQDLAQLSNGILTLTSYNPNKSKVATHRNKQTYGCLPYVIHAGLVPVPRNTI